MRTEAPRRVLYGLGPSSSPYRRQARLVGEAFAREGVELDFLLGGHGQPRLVPSESWRESASDDEPRHAASAERERPALGFGAGSTRALRGVGGFDIGRYAFVLSESEPLSAWASRSADTPCYGIGHRDALENAAPRGPGERAARWIRDRRLPVSQELPTHWFPSAPGVLPPLVDAGLRHRHMAQDFTLVYLPAEPTPPLVACLAQLRSRHFIVYSPAVEVPSQQWNVSLYPAHGADFRHHLERAGRLVCHVEPELVAQALHIGLPVLLKPVDGQTDQQADARALEARKLVRVTHALGLLGLGNFVESADGRLPLAYPDVAREIARQCLHEDPRDLDKLAARLWSKAPSAQAA